MIIFALLLIIILLAILAGVVCYLFSLVWWNGLLAWGVLSIGLWAWVIIRNREPGR